MVLKLNSPCWIYVLSLIIHALLWCKLSNISNPENTFMWSNSLCLVFTPALVLFTSKVIQMPQAGMLGMYQRKNILQKNINYSWTIISPVLLRNIQYQHYSIEKFLLITRIKVIRSDMNKIALLRISKCL